MCACIVINVATIVRKSIGNDDVGNIVYHIVAHNLVECMLCDSNMRSLIFDKNQWLSLSIINDCVATTRTTVESKRNLISNASGGIMAMIGKKGNKVLSYPLLGGECDITMPCSIPYGYVAIFFAFEAVGVCWQIQFNHRTRKICELVIL